MLTPTEQLVLMVHQARAAWIHHVLAPEILQALALCEGRECNHKTSMRLTNYEGRLFCAVCGDYTV